MTQRGDWMRLTTGDHVYDVADPRHIARLESVVTGYCRITFLDSGWEATVPLHDVRKHKEIENDHKTTLLLHLPLVRQSRRAGPHASSRR